MFLMYIKYKYKYAPILKTRRNFTLTRHRSRKEKKKKKRRGVKGKRDRWAFLTTLSYSTQLLSHAIPPIKLSSWIFYKPIQVIQPSANDASSPALFHEYSWSRTARSLPLFFIHLSRSPRQDGAILTLSLYTYTTSYVFGLLRILRYIDWSIHY